MAAALIACGQSTPTTAPTTAPQPVVSPSQARSEPSASAATIPSVGADLPACPADAAWHCTTVDVALDRNDPSLGTIPIHVYIQPRTDQTSPPAEPSW